LELAETHIAHTIPTPIRLQEYAVGIFATVPTKSGIKKAIKKERILVNNTIASTGLFIQEGDCIHLYQTAEKEMALKSVNLSLSLLFEDDFLAIIHKPAGILVSGNAFYTIDNALPQQLQPSSQKDAVRPRPVHRLDYPTSGVLLIGKTSSAITQLNNLFKERTIQKTYHAINYGLMPCAGNITQLIDGKQAHTDYRVLESAPSKRFGTLHLVVLEPKTGRKHQLRKHLKHINAPILGDRTYGKEDLVLQGKGLYLHASSLSFIHPFTQESIHCASPLPKKFKRIFP